MHLQRKSRNTVANSEHKSEYAVEMQNQSDGG